MFSRFVVVRGPAIRLVSSPALQNNAIRHLSHLRMNSSQSLLISSKRHLSTSNTAKKEEKDFFPPPALPKDATVKSTHTPWKHPE